ncbi:MAG: undecaprenyl-phosphate glucose phosphotransferase [Methylococcales bacterium]|nr:undecaprenyl-phosphate glucose phosphotransferase [Methylococcales bacterium]
MGITLWAVIDINHLDWDSKHSWWLLVSIVMFFFVAELNGLYRERRGVLFIKSLKNILLNWFIVLIALISINQFYLLIDPVYEQVFFLWACFVPIELLSWHFMVDSFLCMIRRNGRNSRKAAVIGANNLGFELQRLFEEEDWMGMAFSGIYDDRLFGRGEHSTKKEYSDVRELVDSAKQGKVDIVYITLPLKAEDRIKEIISELSDTTVSVYYVPDFFGFDLLRAQWSSVGNIAVISIYDSPFYGVDGVLKRIFDILFSLIALLIIALPMFVIALLVKLTSSGPILFKQRRFGLDGNEISVWKFRSMSVTEDGGTVTQAKKNDPRVTKLGKFLRKTSLDELPQFINVLQGRMSVVGPRPHAVAHNELYRKQIKGYMLRHKVKPGITGLAQVRGYRGETDTLDKMEGRIKYDLEYIRHWSLYMDIKIVFLTVFNVFLSEDVY